MRRALAGLALTLVPVSGAPPPSPVSPGGAIAFVREDPRSAEPNAGVDIWLVRADGAPPSRLVAGLGHDEQPAWSPRGGRIAFARTFYDRDDPDVLRSIDVWVAEPRRHRNITRDSGSSSPSWSPSGNQVAVARGDGVVKLDADGRHKVRIARRDDPGRPAWSPDGRSVAFTTPGELRLVGAGGGGERLLARGAGSGTEVSWSPDGRFIAFTARRDGVTGAYVVAARKGRPRLLARDYVDPVWAPDGRTIAVVREGSPRDGGIFLVGAPQGVPRRLTRGFDSEVSWSPDASWLAFKRGLDGDIYIVRASGGGLRNLTRTPRLDEREPAWRLR